MIKFIVLTLFTQAFDSFLNTSIISRAIKNNNIKIDLIDIRNYTMYNNKKVDFPPYGGGNGMVISAEPLSNAIEYAISLCKNEKYKIIYLSPRGKLLNYSICKQCADSEYIYILICGHYEGIDERIIEEYSVEEISIGDYVLTGGEIPAMVFIDSVSRLYPNVISVDSLKDESHTNNLLEYPQYTKPRNFRNRQVPDVLLSGHDKRIEEYRHSKSLEITKKNRPDILKKINVKNLD